MRKDAIVSLNAGPICTSTVLINDLSVTIKVSVQEKDENNSSHVTNKQFIFRNGKSTG